MMPSRPWFRWYPADFLADTRLLSLEEQGAYRALLDYLWISGPVEPTARNLASILHANGRQIARIWPQICIYFEEVEGGKIDHPKLAKQRTEANEKTKKARRAGRLGGLANAKANARANALPTRAGTRSHPRAGPEPERSKQHTPTTSEVTVEGDAPVKWTPEQQAERERLQSDLEKARRAAGVGESGGLRAIAGSVPAALGRGALKEEEND